MPRFLSTLLLLMLPLALPQPRVAAPAAVERVVAVLRGAGGFE
jgi:hypothetical protein